ncbi:MAG: hypothetical protein EA349_08325 [Halomonadaceae bacterium]|nr:MAG: hypothetical protein EA349_08325 [Halomonadaceae bacterium]
MKNPARHLLFTGLLALSLAACDSSSSSSRDAADNSPPDVNTSSDEATSLVQTRNEFTDTFCPVAASGADDGMDAMACESEGAQNIGPATAGELASFCPETADSGTPATDFPLSCLSEADALFSTLAPIMGGLSPLAEQLCPVSNGAGNSNPLDCFSEAIANASGQFPGSSTADFGDLPEFDGLPEGNGIPGADAFAQQICPRTAATEEFGRSTPFECLTEAGRNLQMASELLFQSNPLTELACPRNSIANPVDPAACFIEAAGTFVPSEIAQFNQIPGLAGFDGIPGLDRLTALPDQFGGDTDDLPGLDGLTELADLLNGGDDSGLPLLGGLPILGDLLGSGAGDDLPGLDSLTQLTDLLGGGADGLPGLDSLTGLADLLSGGGDFDFPGGDTPDIGLDGLAQLAELLSAENADLPGLDSLTALVAMLSGGDDAGLPGTNSLPGIDQFCGPDSDPFSCLLAAGDNFGAIQELLSDDMLAGSVCPMAGATDPAACFTELLGSLSNLPEGDLPLIGDLLGTLTSVQP